MSLPALLSAVEENLPIVVVVFNNGILGWVRHSQVARGEELYKSSLIQFDYAGIGAAMNMASFHVSDAEDLLPAITDAVKAGKPALLVVDVSTEQKFFDLKTPLMA